jgi:hypothetical protein
MVEVANPAGRLITFRVRSPVEEGNADKAAIDLRRLIMAVSGRVVICSDLTDAHTFAPTTVERFLQVMKADNPRLERSALLLGNNSATFAMQIERLVREANNPARLTFRDTRAMVEWLRPSLSSPEEAALVGFLAAM